jgi:hypothetical protein
LPGHELPWLQLVLMYASTLFVGFMGRRQLYLRSLQAGKEIRFAAQRGSKDQWDDARERHRQELANFVTRARLAARHGRTI